MAESQCALLGKSTNLLIAIERPVWLTGRQRQQKAGHCDTPPGKTPVFIAETGQVFENHELHCHPWWEESPRARLSKRAGR
jgi:hypothetical protein